MAAARYNPGLTKPTGLPAQAFVALASAITAAQTGADALVPPVPCQPAGALATLPAPL